MLILNAYNEWGDLILDEYESFDRLWKDIEWHATEKYTAELPEWGSKEIYYKVKVMDLDTQEERVLEDYKVTVINEPSMLKQHGTRR